MEKRIITNDIFDIAERTIESIDKCVKRGDKSWELTLNTYLRAILRSIKDRKATEDMLDIIENCPWASGVLGPKLTDDMEFYDAPNWIVEITLDGQCIGSSK